jgi:hypothetical protein
MATSVGSGLHVLVDTHFTLVVKTHTNSAWGIFLTNLAVLPSDDGDYRDCLCRMKLSLCEMLPTDKNQEDKIRQPQQTNVPCN